VRLERAAQQASLTAAWQRAGSTKAMEMTSARSSAERWRAMASALLRAQPPVTPSQAMAAVLRKGILQETRLPAWRALASREKRLALETGVQSAL
jgi:hypothetical protein